MPARGGLAKFRCREFRNETPGDSVFAFYCMGKPEVISIVWGEVDQSRVAIVD